MPKAKTDKPPFKDWKRFRLLDGAMRWLPEWADKPLGFTFNPDEALKRGAMAKPRQGWGKVIITGRSTRH